MKKKWLSLILTGLCFAAIPATVIAEEETEGEMIMGMPAEYFYDMDTYELHGMLSEELYITAENYLPNETMMYQIYVSEHYEEEAEAALLVQLDMLMPEQCAAMEDLVAEGKAPAFIAIGVHPGTLKATTESGYDLYMRGEEYDEISTDLPNFLIEELIPTACEAANVTLSENPDMHMISGGSSSGQAAWRCCWLRNDYFRRTFMASPSFHSLQGGAEFLEYLSKCEPRPIRSYLTWGGYEFTGYQGSNWEVGISVLRMLDYNGYEYAYDYFEDEGHCYGLVDYNTELTALTYLWEDWDSVPISVRTYNSDLGEYVEYGSGWTEIEPSDMPEAVKASTENGTYEAEGGSIYLTKEDGTRILVAEEYKDISALAVSTDLWKLYVTDRQMRYVYMMSINEDGTLKDRREIAPLHIIGISDIYGGKDICVDTEDHKYIATDIGIQISGNTISAILPLPEDLPADQVRLSGNQLYTMSGDRCFVREITKTGRETDAEITAPANSTEYVTETPIQFYWDMKNFLPQHPFVILENEQ